MSDTWNAAPVATEPQAQAPVGSWDSAPQVGPSVQQKAVVSANDNGDEAARAIRIQKQTGIPASVVQTDLPGYDAHARQQDAKKAVENPYVAKYVDQHDMGAKVSGDDYPKLDEVSQSVQNLQQDNVNKQASVGLIQGIPEMAMMLGSPAGRAKLGEALMKLPKALFEGVLDFVKTPGDVASGKIDLNTPEGLDKGISFGIAAALGGRDIRLGKPTPPPGSVSFDTFMSTLRGMETRADIDAFLKEKAEADSPPGAKLQIAKAETASDALSKTIEVAQESKTKTRSPEMFENFLEGHDSGNVHIDPQKVMDLYMKEGKVPAEGDGLFGFVPNLAKQLEHGLETGAEITIPVSKYVANVDPAVHERLRDSVRLHDDGVTLEEAKEQEKAIEAWHGTPHDFENFDLTKIGTGEGAQVYGHGLYFAENKAVGEGYQKSTGFVNAVQKYKDQGLTNEEALKKAAEEPVGQLYKVSIKADPQDFLDWDRPLTEQQSIFDKIAAHDTLGDVQVKGEVTGEDFYSSLQDHLEGLNNYKDLSEKVGGPGMVMDQSGRDASKMLAEAGIPGIKYLDQGSRPGPGGMNSAGMKLKQPPATRNYVVFDDKLVKITEKNGNPIVDATVAATEKAKAELYLHPMFENAKVPNITEPEFAQYSKKIDKTQEAVLSKAVTLAKKEAARRLTPEWKANEAELRNEVETDLRYDPAFVADHFFRTGEMPNGEKVAKQALTPQNAEAYAPLFGFDSGAALQKAVDFLAADRAANGKGPKAQFDNAVKLETARRMEEKHGNLQNNIDLAASEAALSEYEVDLLAFEMKMLAKAGGFEPPLKRAEIDAFVKNQFENSDAKLAQNYERYRRSADKSGREAEKQLLKGDFVEAFKAKQRQVLSVVLAKEAKGFAKEVDRTDKLIGKYDSEINLPKVDQAYTDQIHALLTRYGVNVRRTPENIAYNTEGKDISAFIAERTAQGAKIPAPVLPLKPLKEFTVNEFRDFSTLLKSLDHAGREEKLIEVNGLKEEYENVIGQAAKNLDTLEKKNFDPDARGVISALRTIGREVDSRLLKAEKLIDWIDKKDPLGVLNQSILRGLIEGEQKKGDMITRLAGMAKELPATREWGKNLPNQVENKELLDWETREPMKLTNENKVAIALNYGNLGNRRVLLNGYHWTEGEVEAFLDRTMTPEDWKMTDALFDLFSPLAEHVEAATSRRTGVPVPLVEPTPFGQSKGGYYPLVSDPRWTQLGAKVKTDLFDKTNFDPLPTAPALKRRTGAVYPVDLTISRIHSILNQTVHAVFMQEPVINANKVISDPIIREGIAKGFGPEYVSMLDDWIKDIANNGGQTDDRKAAWLSRNVRENVVAMLMGYKVSTALIHGGSAGASSMYELGKMNMKANGAISFAASPATLIKNMRDLGLGQFLPNATRRFFSSESEMFDTVDWVLANSGEMRNRTRSLQKDFGFQMDKITNDSAVDDLSQVRRVYQAYSMSMVAFLDQLTATPVFKAAYDKATIGGAEHNDAVFIADKAVREAHGSASLVSRANIGRGEINKWLTIAYNGYWNHNYNKMREAGKEVAFGDAGNEKFTGGERLAIGAAFMTALIVAPALIHHAIRGEEEDTFGKAIAAMIVSQFGGTVPLVNSLTYGMIHNRDPSVSPIDEVLKSASNVVRDQLARNPKHTTKHAMQALGYTTGLGPTNQLIDVTSFINDVLQRKQDPKTVQEWARGILSGNSKPRKR